MQDAAFLSSHRFDDIARLCGDEALARFSRVHVCVVGVDGAGSQVVEALARSGIGRLTLIGLDNIAESNANRQLRALTDSLGKTKVIALRERTTQISPRCEVTETEDFMTEDNLDELFRWPFDFVINTIDQTRVKAAMAAYFVQYKQPSIISGGAGGQEDPALIQTADLSHVTHDPLLSSPHCTLRRCYGSSRDTKEKIHVPCVYPTKSITPPQSGEACSTDIAPQGLSCAGYGTNMLVTTLSGLYCAQTVVEHIAGRK